MVQTKIELQFLQAPTLCIFSSFKTDDNCDTINEMTSSSKTKKGLETINI